MKKTIVLFSTIMMLSCVFAFAQNKAPLACGQEANAIMLFNTDEEAKNFINYKEEPNAVVSVAADLWELVTGDYKKQTTTPTLRNGKYQIAPAKTDLKEGDALYAYNEDKEICAAVLTVTKAKGLSPVILEPVSLEDAYNMQGEKVFVNKDFEPVRIEKDENNNYELATDSTVIAKEEPKAKSSIPVLTKEDMQNMTKEEKDKIFKKEKEISMTLFEALGQRKTFKN